MGELNLHKFIVCRNLLKDSIFIKLAAYLDDTQDIGLRNDLITELIEKAEMIGLSGNLIRCYTVYLMSQGNHIVAVMAERSNGQIGASLFHAFQADMATMYHL